jgi:hypothetical protein
MQRAKELPDPRGRVRFLSGGVEVDEATVSDERSGLLRQCEAAKSEHLRQKGQLQQEQKSST